MEWADGAPEPLFDDSSQLNCANELSFPADPVLGFPPFGDESAARDEFGANVAGSASTESSTGLAVSNAVISHLPSQGTQSEKNLAFNSYILPQQPKPNEVKPPCVRCQELKLTCDGNLPCSRCVRRGLQGKCSRPPTRGVDAPVSWRRDGYVELGKESEERVVGPHKLHEAVKFLAGLMSKRLGANLTWIEAILDNVTPKLKEALADTLGNLLATDVRLAALKPVTLTKKAGARVLDLYPHTPYSRTYFDWANRVVEVDVNRFLMSMFGQHPEEFLDRLARSAIPPVVTDTDMLCTVLDELLFMMGGKPNSTAWMQRFNVGSVISPDTNQYIVIFFRSTMKLVYGEDGRVAVVEKWMQPSTREEYDVARETTPELCRPLQSAAGDGRSGSEIVHTHMHERYKEAIVSATTETTQSKLDALADTIRTRYAPLVDRALNPSEAASHAYPVPVPPRAAGGPGA